MYVLHRTFGLIWQKVIYISIPLVARVKRRAASIHRTSERAHSRKLTVASSRRRTPGPRVYEGGCWANPPPYRGCMVARVARSRGNRLQVVTDELPENLSCVALRLGGRR